LRTFSNTSAAAAMTVTSAQRPRQRPRRSRSVRPRSRSKRQVQSQTRFGGDRSRSMWGLCPVSIGRCCSGCIAAVLERRWVASLHKMLLPFPPAPKSVPDPSARRWPGTTLAAQAHARRQMAQCRCPVPVLPSRAAGPSRSTLSSTNWLYKCVGHCLALPCPAQRWLNTWICRASGQGTGRGV
jgi:hypothetical protein